MSKGKILVIEGDSSVRRNVDEILTDNGYKVYCFDNDAEAFAVLMKEDIDLVILDVAIPQINGYEICRQIRKNFAQEELPIIFFTIDDQSESVLKGFRCGGSDFIHKNSAIEILIARVEVHLQIKRAFNQFKEFSLTDDLTQTYNRRHAMFTVKEWFARSIRYGTLFSLIYIDVNDLKKTNDLHGHQAGDLLLRSMVAHVKKTLRESDMLFRMGGDEFMILCPDTDRRGAEICVDRMKNALQGMVIVDQPVTFAYGIAASSEKYDSMDAMLHIADSAMYACKIGMKNDLF